MKNIKKTRHPPWILLRLCIISTLGLLGYTLWEIHQIKHETNQVFDDLHQIRKPENTITNKQWLVYALKKHVPVIVDVHRFTRENAQFAKEQFGKSMGNAIDKSPTGSLLSDGIAFLDGYDSRQEMIDRSISREINIMLRNQDKYDWPISMGILALIDSVTTAKAGEIQHMFPYATYRVLHRLDMINTYNLKEPLATNIKNHMNTLYPEEYDHLNYLYSGLVYDAKLHNEIIKHTSYLLNTKLKKLTERRNIKLGMLGIALLLLLVCCWYEIGHIHVSKFGGTILILTYLGLLANIMFMSLLTIQVGISRLVVDVLFPWETNNIEISYINKSVWDLLSGMIAHPTPTNIFAMVLLTFFSVLLGVYVAKNQLIYIYAPHNVTAFMENCMKAKYLTVVDIMILLIVGVIVSMDATIANSVSTHGGSSDSFITLEMYNNVWYREGLYAWILLFFFSLMSNQVLERKYYLGIYKVFRNTHAEARTHSTK